MATSNKEPKSTKSKHITRTAFKKGNQAGKGYGRPPLSPEEKALSLASRTAFKTILARYMTWTMGEIEKALEMANLPVLDMAVLRCLKESATGGSMERIDWALNHLLGKPKETSHVNISGGLDNSSEVDLKKLSVEELLTLKQITDKAKK